MIKHLQDQLSEKQVTSDQLAASRVKEQLHRTQMEQLRVELEEAKKNHTPEMRHFEALQAKIIAMENRKLQRESDIERMVDKSAQAATADKQKEIHQYRDLVMKKNLEIERFRSELDSILDVLRELQRQGVVLPGYRHKETELL
ncbi:putative centrosomal protein [Apostichopus japonicus]|uniref:Centrosomal protein of 162 kDa n=1 Tax=Stichopus japonicus TaxID=307972 RepID=A0A2G8KWD3_STIJA|nr:putative centrosomal protein [Apostichopus japonicus]